MAPASKGRIVLVTLRYMGEPKTFNGSDEHPAIVTATFQDTLINARVLTDGMETLWVTSIPNSEAAEPGYGGSTWRWPPRVEE